MPLSCRRKGCLAEKEPCVTESSDNSKAENNNDHVDDLEGTDRLSNLSSIHIKASKALFPGIALRADKIVSGLCERCLLGVDPSAIKAEVGCEFLLLLRELASSTEALGSGAGDESLNVHRFVRYDDCDWRRSSLQSAVGEREFVRGPELISKET